jgi:hypothetical protein
MVQEDRLVVDLNMDSDENANKKGEVSRDMKGDPEEDGK